jgi:hypothetical protein
MATVAAGIARLGFRAWYERQLIESHAWFVTAFLGTVLVMALLEGINLRGPGPLSLLTLAMVVLAVLVSAIALRRYMSLLNRAEVLAGQCTCASCGAYGMIRVVDADAASTMPQSQWMRVACKKCNHGWRVGLT